MIYTLKTRDIKSIMDIINECTYMILATKLVSNRKDIIILLPHIYYKPISEHLKQEAFIMDNLVFPDKVSDITVCGFKYKFISPDRDIHVFYKDWMNFGDDQVSFNHYNHKIIVP